MPTPLQSSRVEVEIVALAGGLNFCKTVMVPKGQTLEWAANASGLFAQHPALRGAPMGVWGKVMAPSTQVEAGDRIEIYQPVAPQALQNQRARLRAKQNQGKVPA